MVWRNGIRSSSPRPLVLDLLASGESVEELLREYPSLTLDDVLACIAYGSEMSRERFVPIPITPSK